MLLKVIITNTVEERTVLFFLKKATIPCSSVKNNIGEIIKYPTQVQHYLSSLLFFTKQQAYLNCFGRIHWLQSWWSISKYMEMRSWRRPHGCRSIISINLIIDKAPLLKESMNSERNIIQYILSVNLLKNTSFHNL